MRCVYLVVSETARDTKIFSRYLRLMKLVGRKYSTLTSQNKALCKLMVKFIIPATASCITAVLVNSRYIRKIRLFNLLCVRRIFEAVYIVNIARGMELRHEQRIAVPEFSLYKRAVKFLESE